MNLPMNYLFPFLAFAAFAPTVQEPDAERGGGVNIRAAAKRIDRLLEIDMKRAKLTPNPVADDATFLRRAYLGIIGRIPTGRETVRFLNSQGAGKRTELVDTLLGSPGFNSHMFNFWADLLRVKTRLNNQVSGEPFIHFIKESIANNKPYNQFVHEMIKAEGPAHARGNGATGLLMRDRGMPLDSMANTVRVFLGTRLECAQCHDHPFDKWKQKDFYEMAAFAGGLSYRANLRSVPGAASVARVAAGVRREKDRNAQRALNQIMRRVSTGVSGSGTGTLRLPKDYQYDDAKPREAVKAQAIFGKTPKIAYKKPAPKRGQRSRRMSARQRRLAEQRKKRQRRNAAAGPQIGTRAVFATWLTAENNERFAKVIANRLWKVAMGRGLIEPVDNISDATKPSNAPLMKYLEKLMIDCDYDLKKYLSVLYRTQLFQRQVNREEVPADEKFYFQGPMLRRMTAEQVWDSVLTMVVPETDSRLVAVDARANVVYDSFERIINMSEQELREEVQKGKLRYSDPAKYRQMQRARQTAAARTRRAAGQARAKKAGELRKRAQPIYRALIKARRAKDAARVRELEAELVALGIDREAIKRRFSGQKQTMRRRGRNNRNNRNNRTRLVRASDQQHPAPDGHFLRQFGQSDREQIQASHTEANVPQVLALLNGFVEKQVLSNPQSEIMLALQQASSPEEQVRRAFIGILNRQPRGREMAIWTHDIETLGQGAVKDLVWTIVNSHEFRFIQ